MADQILRILESLGFEWDGKVIFQNNRINFRCSREAGESRLQHALGYRTPSYAHFPLLTETAVDPGQAAPTLWEASRWLRQEPPAELARAPLPEIWAWAISHWRPELLAGCRELRLTERPGDPDRGRCD